MFSINVLLYGDFRDLAERCLKSLSYILIPEWVMDVRIGLNDVSEGTRDYLSDWLKTIPPGIFWHVFDPGTNVFKYPLMRRMFTPTYDKSILGPGPHLTMWFDDDSWIQPQWENRGPALLSTVTDIFNQPHVGMAGEIFYQWMAEGQSDWIKRRSWYRGKLPGAKFRFATGGWWTIPTDLLRRFDWPDRSLCHNGGDTALGELMRQHNLEIYDIKPLQLVNINDGVRRGASQHPAGHVSDPVPRLDNHHDFFCRVQSGPVSLKPNIIRIP